MNMFPDNVVTKELSTAFRKDGFVAIEGFFTVAECDSLRARISDIIDEMEVPQELQTQFSTQETEQIQTQGTKEYFLTSGDKIRFFFEKGVFDDKGDFLVPKEKSLNKIGHALHALEPTFKNLTHSRKVQEVAQMLELKQPVILQSMYIFKQPGIGGEAGITRRMLRAPKGDFPLLTFIGMERDYPDDDFIPVPVKKGGLILIHGEVVHKSGPNTSDKSRHVYTFHLMESQDCHWSEDNWLQPTPELPFQRLHT
ncbi:phytanoyl-CoA dioxygenase domain-containing protein 1 isoform X2 [Scyliorhinus torazame]|uniref:phytanoyl-CoA dioxygenase domain-containing protein 1 isoform X2 n=1 Tax=Scyliorhinus torazame TaxID=75743 RepID=UPI003B5AD143